MQMRIEYFLPISLAVPIVFGQVNTTRNPVYGQLLHPTAPLPSFEQATIQPSKGLRPAPHGAPGEQEAIDTRIRLEYFVGVQRLFQRSDCGWAGLDLHQPL
jgi:hypothetical protein